MHTYIHKKQPSISKDNPLPQCFYDEPQEIPYSIICLLKEAQHNEGHLPSLSQPIIFHFCAKIILFLFQNTLHIYCLLFECRTILHS